MHTDIKRLIMENSTVVPVIGDCVIYKHDPLWIIAMVIVSTISTLIAMILRKRHCK